MMSRLFCVSSVATMIGASRFSARSPVAMQYVVVECPLPCGFELAGDAAADSLEGYEQGWDTKHLLALRGIVEGE